MYVILCSTYQSILLVGMGGSPSGQVCGVYRVSPAEAGDVQCMEWRGSKALQCALGYLRRIGAEVLEGMALTEAPKEEE